MAGFYMLAGTLTSDQTLQQLSIQLKDLGVASQLEDDELELDSPASLAIRSGFDHEFILVGDAAQSDVLLTECERLSGYLKQLGLSHEMEIYDTQNELLKQLNFYPE